MAGQVAARELGQGGLPVDVGRLADPVADERECLLAARHGLVPHTFGLEEPDPECGLDLVAGAPRATPVRVSLSTSLGFGGCNAALVLEGEPS